MYHRSTFLKVPIKRLMHSITGTIPSSNVVIEMAGIAKHIEHKAATPLEPKHLRETYKHINHSQYHCPQRKTWKSKRKSRFQ
ncbi:unnamed protein product [Rotaria magnacalcarata]|uniref:TAFII28-like protein domain-containing protein n=1 Tax=Rotaria magnacalcarata TaxID=392030 RepID=A0A816W7S9_9BILA|nr:unnamed protein product [Rotaria magnacalcarata]CAF1634727.1 unnamed protein product [Rotaria magnacalcarata]CAF2083674.1 unnamed protein product [Rotaria magnacalcarata]CAF2093486.1 unnamed protein product [Rotaria magnacalcarata]CAF2133882.1 unnamed protein product [Rotaria magnacalcarata]